MTVLLRRSDDLPPPESYASWAAIDAAGTPDPARMRADLGAAREAAFEASREEWWTIARALAVDPGADLAHMPAAVANVSDLGVMLAWTRLIDAWAGENATTLVICDDPFVFRHLRDRPGVNTGRAPALALHLVRLGLRGIAARGRYSVRAAWSSLVLRHQRRHVRLRAPSLLVYGHPSSNADGRDAYFGDLMLKLSGLARVLHVDCPAVRAAALFGGGRTLSLHAFGTAWAALGLVLVRWRPMRSRFRGANGWLIRRAAAQEGATAQAAAIRWQMVCQRRWIAAARPATIAWPWENHAWERALVREARVRNVQTVGYQHSVIGRHMLNYAPASAVDGAASVPDKVLCTGAATRDQLLRWGVPDERLAIGGALRFSEPAGPCFDPAAAVFVALPFDGRIAEELVAATQTLARTPPVIIKDHPMSPFPFTESDRVRKADQPFARQSRLAAVVFAATTVGLEAILAGIPALRFRPRGAFALDILPEGVNVPTVDASTLAAALAAPLPPPSLAREHIFAPIDLPLWRRHLAAG